MFFPGILAAYLLSIHTGGATWSFRDGLNVVTTKK
jgi:hypothetical protein